MAKMKIEADMNCLVNREIMSLVLKHYSVPAQPDGKCLCNEESSYGAHQADHLIEKMVEHFGLRWRRSTPEWRREPSELPDINGGGCPYGAI